MQKDTQKKRGKPRRDADGLARRTVSASVAGATAEEIETWRAKRNASHPITRMGDLVDHLTAWAKSHNYNPSE